jgi:hypothetical protein
MSIKHKYPLFSFLVTILITIMCLSLMVFPVNAVSTTSITLASQTGGYAVWNDYAFPMPSQGAQGTFNFRQGDTIQFDAVPYNNYVFAGWFLTLTGSNQVFAESFSDPVSITIPTSGTSFTITAHFILASVPTFTLTASYDANSMINPVGITTANQGSSVTYYYSAYLGYQINQVVVDGQSVPITGSYTFSNIQSNHGIYVASVPIPPTSLLVTFVNGTGGGIGWGDFGNTGNPIQNTNPTYGVNGVFGFPNGETLQLEAYPQTYNGYIFANFTISNSATQNGILITNPVNIVISEPETITAYFNYVPTTNYTVIVSTSLGGQLNWIDNTTSATGGSGTFQFNIGDTVTFNAYTFTGNYFKNIYSTFGLLNNGFSNNPQVILPINTNFSISAIFSSSNLNYSMSVVFNPTPLNYNLNSSTTSFILEQGVSYTATFYVTSQSISTVFGSYNVSTTDKNYNPAYIQSTGIGWIDSVFGWIQATIGTQPYYGASGNYHQAILNNALSNGNFQLTLQSNGTYSDTVYQGIEVSVFSVIDNNNFNSPIYTITWLTPSQVVNLPTPPPPTPNPTSSTPSLFPQINSSYIATAIYVSCIVGLIVAFFYMRNNNVPFAISLGLIIATILCTVLGLLGVYTYPIIALIMIVVVAILVFMRN